MLGPRLEDQLRPHGLTLRHFPQSFEFSTLGGWLATRAGGHFATCYTHIDDLVESMRVVTPAGDQRVAPAAGSGAGPSPDRLFLGSEGTLGVITEAWMRLQDAAALAGLGVGALRRLRRRRRRPPARSPSPGCTRRTAGCSTRPRRSSTPASATGGGVLVLGFESADHPVDDRLDRAVELCRDHGGTLPEPPRVDGRQRRPRRRDAAATWRVAFLRMPYQRDALARHGHDRRDVRDRLHLGPLRRPARRGAPRRPPTRSREVCGGGRRHLPVHPRLPRRPGAVLRRLRRRAAGAAASRSGTRSRRPCPTRCSPHGGTITHHHAVGRDHRPWYDRQRPDPFAAALARGQAALDPAGVLNPGVLVL